MRQPLYLDYQATTPLDPRVAAAMQPFLDHWVGNPHSNHLFGWEAERVVDDARVSVGDLIGADPGEIVITSGATEANNLALRGLAGAVADRDHVIISAIEHKCVIEAAMSLRELGFRVDLAPVQPNGIIDVDRLAGLVCDKTAAVSVMLANNEIGTLQPVSDIAKLCRPRGIVLHSDAAQAVGKIPVDVGELGVDLLSISAHKFYGPQGIGTLYIARDCPVHLRPLLLGGVQQEGRRAGTIPVMLSAGLGAACRIAAEQMGSDQEHTLRLQSRLRDRLRAAFPDCTINGDSEHRLAGNLNVRFPGHDAEDLLARLKGRLAASTGSACNSGMIEPSYVLLALGLSVADANSSIRFGFGRFSAVADIDDAVAALAWASADSSRIAAE